MKRAQEERKDDLVYDLKGHDKHFVFALTYFITSKVTMTLTVGLTLVYDPKDRTGIHDLLDDPKGHDDLYGRFDLVYDRKKTRGH